MPQLILTADPSFADLALNEARRDASEVVLVGELAPGILLIDCAEGFWGLAESWRVAPPVFVRHIHPVDVSVPLRDSTDDPFMIVDAVETELAPLLDGDLSFSVQTRILADLPYKPFDVNRAVSNRLQALSAADLDVRNPFQIVSIVCATNPQPPTTNHHAYIGLSLATYNLSNWAGGERRFAREEDQISRAEFKLLEALEAFAITLPPRGIALDLGASPGGWTRILRGLEQFVTAIDPAALDPRLEKDKGVRHLRTTAEAYLADEPDEFDLIVNDMRMDARDSARLMVDYARQLYPHGIALMTFKLPEKGRRAIMQHAFDILRQSYEIAGARQLFHNRSEITVYLRKR